MNTLYAFITGANKGIGLETARILAGKGYFVFLGSRDPVAGEKAIEQLKSEGLGNTAMIRIDVSREASVQEAYEELAGRIPRLDAGGPTGKYISDYGETPW